MNTYRVEARLKFPSWNHNGYDFEIYAKTKAEAIKLARKQVGREGHSPRYDGPISYTAIQL